MAFPLPFLPTRSYHTAEQRMTDHVPVTSNLEDIYPAEALETQRTRWNALLSAFKTQYGRSADFVSRSPGRVNLLGEYLTD